MLPRSKSPSVMQLMSEFRQMVNNRQAFVVKRGGRSMQTNPTNPELGPTGRFRNKTIFRFAASTLISNILYVCIYANVK